jgi:deazaflavin-dependent oxidoreductase (nitroreductase family)
MTGSNDALKNHLSRSQEINITVTGRKSGKAISNPVWFVLDKDKDEDEDKLYLLPVQGSDTQWYTNVLKNPSLRIDAGSAQSEFQAVPITDAARVSDVVEKFRKKYGAKDVKKYYTKLDVAVLAQAQ